MEQTSITVINMGTTVDVLKVIVESGLQMFRAELGVPIVIRIIDTNFHCLGSL